MRPDREARVTGQAPGATTSWDSTDLTIMDVESELHVASYRVDGTLRTSRIVWHVVVDGGLYIRSVRGTQGQWYRGVQTTRRGVVDAGAGPVEVSFLDDHARDAEIDRAYRAKYGDGSAVRAITSLEAAATTLRVDPV